MAARLVLRDGMQGARRSEWSIPFARRATQQTARKTCAREGCAKFCRWLCHAAWLRSPATTCASLRTRQQNLAATRLMEDLIRGSLSISEPGSPPKSLGRVNTNFASATGSIWDGSRSVAPAQPCNGASRCSAARGWREPMFACAAHVPRGHASALPREARRAAVRATASGLRQRGAPKSPPSRRVAAGKRVCGVVALGNGTTIACAPPCILRFLAATLM